MFSSPEEKLEKKVKELNAVKGEYRSAIDEAERQYRARKMDQQQFERIKQRNEEHIERLNEKLREVKSQQHAMKGK
jgi:chromosome segregation ATPase